MLIAAPWLKGLQRASSQTSRLRKCRSLQRADAKPPLRDPKVRSVYITVERIIKFKETPGCKACYGKATVHTPECRKRFTELVEKERKEKEERRSLPPTPGRTVPPTQCLVSPPVRLPSQLLSCLPSQLLSKSRSSRNEPTEGHAERRLKEKALPQCSSTTALPVQLLVGPTLSLVSHTCAFRGSTLTSKTAVFKHKLPTNLTQFQAPIFGERCLTSLVIGVGMLTLLKEHG